MSGSGWVLMADAFVATRCTAAPSASDPSAGYRLVTPADPAG
jgi:hypothetical protein